MKRKTDEYYMALAIEEGKKARGFTGDNPYVGAILVKDGTIIGSGFTGIPGQPHAEQRAIQEAKSKGEEPAGAIIYSTVEPCSFEGRTESCAKLIVKAGISTCVFSIFDPHPNVNGKGKEILEKGGVAVKDGVMKKETEDYLSSWLNKYRT